MGKIIRTVKVINWPFSEHRYMAITEDNAKMFQTIFGPLEEYDERLDNYKFGGVGGSLGCGYMDIFLWLAKPIKIKNDSTDLLLDASDEIGLVKREKEKENAP
jgi:hypothetical protein